MTSSFEVIVSEDADHDIRGILQHTLEFWGQTQHDAYSSVLEHGLDQLSHFPYLGRAAGNRASGRRFLSAGEHLIFYRVDENLVTVLRVIHKRSDYASLVTDT